MRIVRTLVKVLPERTPLPPRRAGDLGRAVGCYTAAAYSAVLYLLLAVGGAWPGAKAAAAGRSPVGEYVATSMVLKHSLVWLLLAALTWLVLWGAEPSSAIGMRRLPTRRLVGAACAVFCLAEMPMFVLGVVWNLVGDRVHLLTAYSGRADRSSFLADAASSVAAGMSEEIIVLVLPALVAWRLGQRVTGPRLRRAGLAVLVVAMAAARLSYHVEYGMSVLQLLPWAIICVLLYLRTRAALPLMIAHASYDLVLAVTNRLGSRYGLAAAVAAFAVVAAAALFTALRQAALPTDQQQAHLAT
jgi:hypothetical protein